jgi:demethylmenaquinone methyltransferase/2-methoxy-6-polyprenyl-1,4-benzoquinol methylase
MPDHQNAAEFYPEQDVVFDRIADRYDILCDIFSCFIHRFWKKAFVDKLDVNDDTILLDLASGTGDIPARILKKHRTPKNLVISDLSLAMISQAKKKLTKEYDNVQYRVLNAESLTDIQSGSISIVTMSLALKICNRQLVFSEVYRVLKPGGSFTVLEASHLPWPWLHKVYLGYMKFCIPIIGMVAAGGDHGAYKYLLRGIEQIPSQKVLASEFKEAGFVDVRWTNLSFGIVAIHSGYRPS